MLHVYTYVCVILREINVRFVGLEMITEAVMKVAMFWDIA
jgi:hypothetical protein